MSIMHDLIFPGKTWGFPAPCPANCPCSCFDCRKSECLCGTPARMCDNFPADFLIDYVRVYQVTYFHIFIWTLTSLHVFLAVFDPISLFYLHTLSVCWLHVMHVVAWYWQPESWMLDAWATDIKVYHGAENTQNILIIHTALHWATLHFALDSTFAWCTPLNLLHTRLSVFHRPWLVPTLLSLHCSVCLNEILSTHLQIHIQIRHFLLFYMLNRLMSLVISGVLTRSPWKKLLQGGDPATKTPTAPRPLPALLSALAVPVVSVERASAGATIFLLCHCFFVVHIVCNR